MAEKLTRDGNETKEIEIRDAEIHRLITENEKLNRILGEDTRFQPVDIDDFSTDPKEIRELAKVFGELARYATHKATAMSARTRGEIESAQVYERDCERTYKQLPEWARW